MNRLGCLTRSVCNKLYIQQELITVSKVIAELHTISDWSKEYTDDTAKISKYINNWRLKLLKRRNNASAAPQVAKLLERITDLEQQLRYSESIIGKYRKIIKNKLL